MKSSNLKADCQPGLKKKPTTYSGIFFTIETVKYKDTETSKTLGTGEGGGRYIVPKESSQTERVTREKDRQHTIIRKSI